jgi:hypothetical protein
MDIDQTLTTIRSALAVDATLEARTAGANACRVVMALLVASEAPTPAAPALNPAAIATAITALRGVPPDQLLDLAIAELRAALPAGTQATPANAFKMPFVPVLPRVAQ